MDTQDDSLRKKPAAKYGYVCKPSHQDVPRDTPLSFLPAGWSVDVTAKYLKSSWTLSRSSNF